MIDALTFWDRQAEKYARIQISDPEAYELTLTRTRSYLGPKDSVLELGAGTASTALRLCGSVARYTASDIAPAMVEIGRRKATEAQADRLELVAADASDPRFATGDRDAVLAFNLLHLVDDLPATLAQIAAMLRPGGLFISKTFCLPDRRFGSAKLALIRLALPVMQMLGKAPRVHFMPIADLEGMIAAAGFEIVETGNYPASPPRRFIVARKI